MKTTCLTAAMVLILTFTAVSQDYPIPYEYSCHSAPATITYFNFDITDSIYIIDGTVHNLIFRDQGSETWNSAVIDLLFEACETFTYSGSTSFQPSSGIMEWYFRSEADTAVVSQSPKNSADQFPVPEYFLADLGADAVGDNSGGTTHDITHFYGSYSDSKLYFRLDNNGGGFPTSGGLLTYYIYSIGLINPNATDSTAYVLLYAEVPLLFSTGLYALDLTDSSFTNIGSVSANISGNSLSMSCNISDLTSQPGWPDWPPQSGFIGAAPVTATANFTDLSTNDFGKSAIFIPSSNLLNFTMTNTAPILSDVSAGYDETGLISFEITYTDTENNLPVERVFYFEGEPSELTACEKNYQAGTVFSHEELVSESGWYEYYFEFSDGVETVTTPVDSIYVDLMTFICGDANADSSVNVSDAVYIINYVFSGGNAPDPLESGDTNCDLSVNVSDAVYLINYVFSGGNMPCDPDGDLMPDC